VITFRKKPHRYRAGIEIVEVLEDNEVIGAIYPTEDGIKIVSAHISKNTVDKDFAGEAIAFDNPTSFPPIPSVNIAFEPGPYEIRGGKVVKLPKN